MVTANGAAGTANETLHYVHSTHLGVPVGTWSIGTTAVPPTATSLPTGTMLIGFPGQLQSLSDLYYNQYRDYDPTTGRYIQADPIGLAGDANPYSYAGANPVNATDALGLFPVDPRYVPGYGAGLGEALGEGAASAGARGAASAGARTAVRTGLRVGGRVIARALPGVGLALLALDLASRVEINSCAVPRSGPSMSGGGVRPIVHVVPGNRCAAIYAEIEHARNELARRLVEFRDDRNSLPANGPNSRQGHADQFYGWQRRLRRLIEAALALG